MGCTVAAVSAQRPVEHFKNALQNIMTDRTQHSVLYVSKKHRWKLETHYTFQPHGERECVSLGSVYT